MSGALAIEAASLARSVTPPNLTLRELAAGLAKINRLAGKTNPFFSVAQHSVIVADQLADDAMVAMCGLLHDAHEIVTNDIPTWLPEWLAGRYGENAIAHLKAAIDAILFPKFGLPWPLPPQVLARVAYADQRAFKTELRDIAWPLCHPHDCGAPPLSNAIRSPWPWPKAEEHFLKTWHRFSVLVG